MADPNLTHPHLTSKTNKRFRPPQLPVHTNFDAPKRTTSQVERTHPYTIPEASFCALGAEERSSRSKIRCFGVHVALTPRIERRSSSFECFGFGRSATVYLRWNQLRIHGSIPVIIALRPFECRVSKPTMEIVQCFCLGIDYLAGPPPCSF
jgi:hypothetical protein